MFGAGRFFRSSVLGYLVKSLLLSEPQIDSAKSPQSPAWVVPQRNPAPSPALFHSGGDREPQMPPACGLGWAEGGMGLGSQEGARGSA